MSARFRKLLTMRLRSSSKVGRRTEDPPWQPDEPELLAPEEVVFLICVEANRLEPQALLLCASIRRFGGRYRDVPIVAVAPRQHLWLSAKSQAQLEALDVTYVALPLNTTGNTYGTINRIVAGAWAEAELPQPYLVVLDTDTLVVSEPEFVHADVGVRPVDVKGSATTGADDQLDAYWAQLCWAAGIDVQQLPMLHTTIDSAGDPRLVQRRLHGGPPRPRRAEPYCRHLLRLVSAGPAAAGRRRRRNQGVDRAGRR